MGLFDNAPNNSQDNTKSGNRTVDIVFSKLPENFEEFKALPQASLLSPFETA